MDGTARTDRVTCSGRIRRCRLALGLILLALGTPALHAAEGSLRDTTLRWPTWAQIRGVVLLEQHNTRVVVLGVSGLGLAAGMIGAFLLLRERALLSDAVSHAMLPGIGLAFIVMTALGGTGKTLSGLLVGATVAGLLSAVCVLFITRYTRIKQDAALGIVLSVFFGLGVAILGLIQNMGTGHAAGLETFIYGKTASMLTEDAIRIGVVGAVCAVICLLLFKEFMLVCFDQAFAGAQGWPVAWLDIAMMALAVAVTVIGLQAVGLILMIALLIVPAAAARFWTNRLPRLVWMAALLGAVSGLLGAAFSALVPRLPAGAVVVVVAGVLFLFSMVFGTVRGMLARWRVQHDLSRKVARQHLLRAVYELGGYADNPRGGPIAWDALLAARTWSPRELRRALSAAQRAGLVELTGDSRAPTGTLTDAGVVTAWRVTRNYHLWALYLLTYADVARGQVDRDADRIEHVVAPALFTQLEGLLGHDHPDLLAPPGARAVAGLTP